MSTTTDGMWRPNRTFRTLGQEFTWLRLKAKWWAFQCRRRGDVNGEAFWTRVAEYHAAELAQLQVLLS